MWVKLASGRSHIAQGKNGKRQQMWSPRSWENWPKCSQRLVTPSGKRGTEQTPFPKDKKLILCFMGIHTLHSHTGGVWQGTFMQQNCFGWERCERPETLLCLLKHLPQSSLRWRHFLPQITDCTWSRIWAVLKFLRDCPEQLVFLYFPVKGSVRHLLKQTTPCYFNVQAALPSNRTKDALLQTHFLPHRHNGLYNNTSLCQEIPVEDTVTQKKQSVSLLDVNIS